MRLFGTPGVLLHVSNDSDNDIEPLEFGSREAYTPVLVPATHPNADEDESQRIISPFAQTTSTIEPAQKGPSISWPLWIVSGLLLAVVLGIFAYFTYQYLENPFRTLEPFPVDKYLSDYRSLSGAKFRADLKVSADLGWKDGVGRLMVFTVADDSRPVVVLIPPKLGSIFFTKGQNYQASLEVGEGGLVYADSFEKE
jgi:hypothetical protein